jgi:predicted RNA-binding protein YlxR (DUF448 family)/ribosomal protein L30E
MHANMSDSFVTPRAVDGGAAAVAEAIVVGGPKGRWRRDLVLRQSGDTRAMLRFVVDAERRLVPDLAERLPGRGFWVSADAASVQTAVKKRLFDRQAGGPVAAPSDLPELIERLLAQRCLDAMGLARRAGDLVTGFDQVAAVLATGEPGVLIEASDAAEHGRRKLRARHGDAPVVASFTRAELGRALGRDAVVHAWLRNGRLATRLLEDAAKLEGFRRPRPEDAGERGVDEQQGIRRAR